MERSTERAKWRWTQSLSVKRRVKKRTGTRIMPSSSLPELTRTHTIRRFTDETPVIECTWRFTCGPPLPRTRCRLWQSSWRQKSRRLVPPITDVFTQQVADRSTLISYLGKLIARSKSMTRDLKEGWIHEEISMSSISQNSVSTDIVRVNGVTWRTTFCSLKGGVRDTKECALWPATQRDSVSGCVRFVYRGKADDLSLHSVDNDGLWFPTVPSKSSLISGTSHTPDVCGSTQCRQEQVMLSCFQSRGPSLDAPLDYS